MNNVCSDPQVRHLFATLLQHIGNIIVSNPMQRSFVRKPSGRAETFRKMLFLRTKTFRAEYVIMNMTKANYLKSVLKVSQFD